jgi:hypothetical protein
MKSARFTLPAIALVAFTACGDPTGTDGLYDDAAVTADVAASAGDAIATMLVTLADNEAFGQTGAGAEYAGGAAAGTTDLSVQRTRACYNDVGDAVPACVPFSSVRMITIAATINGTRTSTRTNAQGATVTWTGAVHRTANDTTIRAFNATTEVSRTHTAIGVGNDTTTFTDGAFTRKLSEAVRDSVKALKFNLPRSSSPYPVSGSIVRRATVKVEITKDGQSVSRDGTHRVEVIFPADAQGNVTLNIDAKTCQLNLVTKAVTNCQ